jgi:hypothetical protein
MPESLESSSQSHRDLYSQSTRRHAGALGMHIACWLKKQKPKHHIVLSSKPQFNTALLHWDGCSSIKYRSSRETRAPDSRLALPVHWE